MNKYRNLLTFLLCLLIISLLCTEEPPKGGLIKGVVRDTKGGSPVAYSKVYVIKNILDPNQFVTMSNEDGYFEFTVLPGEYDILFMKDGLASTRLQRVKVDEGVTLDYDVLQYPVSDVNRSVIPPTITLSGIEPEQEYCSQVQISIEVSGENIIFGQYMHYVIYFYYGNHSNSSSLVHDSSFFTFNWNPMVLPSGLSNIEVVAYDINNNRCQLKIPIYICSISGNPPQDPIKKVYVISETYGSKHYIYGKSVSTKTAPQDTIISTQVYWTASTDSTGYNIYRSKESENNFSYAGVIPYNTTGTNLLSFVDTSAELNLNDRFIYKVEPYNHSGFGTPIISEAISFLPPYKLYNSFPENNSTVSPTNLSLSWSCSNYISDATRIDFLYVWNVNNGQSVWGTHPYNIYESNLTPQSGEIYFTNSNSVIYSGTQLLNGQSYEWSIYKSYYYKKIGTYNGSYSFPTGFPSYDPYSLNYGSSNGSYYFITD